MATKMLCETYLAEDAGLQFWALWKEMAEQLKIQKTKRQLVITCICYQTLMLLYHHSIIYLN